MIKMFTWLGTYLIGLLLNAAGSLTGQILLSLGFAAVTMTGVTVTIDWFISQIQTSVNGLPVEALNVLSVLRIGHDIAILTGAVSAKLAFQGLTSGSFTFYRMRKSL